MSYFVLIMYMLWLYEWCGGVRLGSIDADRKLFNGNQKSMRLNATEDGKILGRKHHKTQTEKHDRRLTWVGGIYSVERVMLGGVCVSRVWRV